MLAEVRRAAAALGVEEDLHARVRARVEALLGREAKVRISEPVEGRRNFTGVIERAGETDFVLKLLEGGAEVELPFGSVSRAHLKEDI